MSSCVSEPLSPCVLVSDAACACPDGYSRHGARCLLLLDELQSDWAAAQAECSARAGHLAVPRIPPEVDRVNSAAAAARARVWLGMDHNSAGVLQGHDGCGLIGQHFWASSQPDYTDGRGALSHSPPALGGAPDWYNEKKTGGPFHPLCQLAYCYRPDCPA